MKKNDVILIVVLLAAALAVFGGISLFSAKSGKDPEAVVYLDGEKQGSYPLNQDASVKIQSASGGYNILEIRAGTADITEASCPDKICVNHRPVKNPGESLVCLPNKLVVEIENGGEAEVDGSVR
ncbi:hypothetical protein IMSAGC013_04454 [Lachnospiraceae bacterium]|nr:NusG domain II-containing protein [Lachnospiraceae bacterium]MCI9059473.1 NusG domain II-containing protein [Lachnospiraceae bacterium]GFI33047.1 hypothetical protein IMSAGC013_04454 [Lachnospiraceae bacterium]